MTDDIQPAATNQLQQRRDCEMRELHVAMLGHDLRNPVTAITNAARIIAQRSEDKMIRDMAKVIQSSGHRMAAMVNNIMGFSRCRVGEGWLADIKPEAGLEEKLEQTVAEHLVNAKGRIIERSFDIRGTVHCDSTMILQVAANLLSNALTHGHPEHPIHFRAQNTDGGFTLSVMNAGKDIPKDELEQIFRPFAQTGNTESRRKGLGLGLHIVSEIAAAHQGTIRVESEARSTVFTLSIPNRQK